MVRLNLNLIFIFFLFFLLSCTRTVKKEYAQSSSEKVKIEGKHIPADSLVQPAVIVAGKPLIVIASFPTVVQVKNSDKIIAEPNKFQAGMPSVCTPGKNGFSEPVRVPSTGQSFFSTTPEIVEAENPSSKDINPHGFSSFGTIQGLKTNQIRSMMQDHDGNLWFSSDDGVTRYDGKYLTHFVISNGIINNNIILCMLEDRAGSLWFGTFGGGLVSFDGKKFTQYTVKEGLSSNTVNCLIEDRTGNLWMGISGGGISKFDRKVFTHYTIREGLPANQVRSIFQDKVGAIWIGTFGGGISRFDGSNFQNYSVKEGFPATHVASIIQDRTGNMWFGSYNRGIIKYDGQFFYQYTERHGLRKSSVLCMLQDDDGIFWLGTSGGGIFRFDGKAFDNYTEDDGLPNNYIRCSLQGRQGNIWFGTRDGGLVRFNKNLFTHYTDNEGLGNSKVLSIMQDRKGNIWFGTFGGGITRYDGKEFANYSLKESLLNDFVYTLMEDNDGSVWLGSDGGGITRFDGKNLIQYTQNEGLCNNSIRCMLRDRNQQMWIGSYGGGVSKFDGKTFINYTTREGLSNDKVMCMLEDKKGNLWFGTDGGGVTRFDGKVFTHFTAKEGLNSNSIASILQDDKGNLWFGSLGGGATRFDGEFITVFSENEGLSNNYINSLLQDHKGNIWMGTRSGPNVLKAGQLQINGKNSKPLQIKNFSYDDGFLGIGCNLSALLEDRNGTIWIGSSNRLSALRPEVESPDTVPLNVKLTNIKLFDEKIPWLQIESNKDTSFVLGNGVKVGNFKFSASSKWYFMPEDLSLAYNNNFLSFSFIGISQKQTLKIRYQYQLEGLDKNWSALTGQTEISYGNLKPGNYTFKVKAMNSEGIWSKESQYSFTIRHPWWRSWWFYSFLFLLAGSLFYSYIKWRELEHELHKKLLNKKIEEQTYELKEKNKELGNKNDELQAVNSEKDKFFSIIAHDVRGPLSTFLSFTEIMADNLQSYTMDEIQVMAESMKKSATSLFELLENLLEWARMQRGLIQYNPERLTLIEVLKEAIETIHHSAKNKSIALVIEMPSDLEVVADKNMLASIFRNLTSNAVKFTPDGGKVTVRAEKRGNNQIEVSVTDTGIGMEQKMIEELFRIDVHNNRRGTNGEVSNGFGLLLSRDFVHKLNGRIWAESEPDKGSTFYFTLQSAQSL